LEQQNNILTDRVKRAGRGDADAQAWLYRQYGKAMYNICIRMTGNREDAGDTLQEAFILAFNNLGQLKEPASFGSWLRRIVVNECIRSGKRLFHWKDLDEQHEDAHSQPEDATAWWMNINLELVHREIQELPGGCRQVFVLYVLENYSHKGIAAELGISESTSKSQYQRARQLLKERITRQIALHG
jgi:RNA polymerase sigma factor (sigma-70 family)